MVYTIDGELYKFLNSYIVFPREPVKRLFNFIRTYLTRNVERTVEC